MIELSYMILSIYGFVALNFKGSLSTVVGDEKLTSREDRIGPFFYVCSV